MIRTFFRFKTILLVVLASTTVGLLLAARFDWVNRLKAVQYFQEGQPVSEGAVQPASFGFGALPSFVDLAKKVKPAVVNVSTTKVIKRPQGGQQFGSPFGPQGPFDDFFDRFFDQGGPQERKQQSLGSGFLINKDGYILTNNHVVEQADEIMVQLSNKEKLKAEIVGTDPKTDLAVIKIAGHEDLPYVALGDSDAVEVGEWVVAVG
ncbi:MAG: trypsin-like peptidase domain-containing protein, partial [bacterium]|nr:trypsin-like peptidase domain-containing protein [bacterium]